MVYRADMSVINFLLTSRASSNQEKLHESSKTSANYIIIDYFDWLEYINRIENHDLIDGNLFEFRTIYSDCKDIVRILKSKLTSANISNILQSNKKMISGNTVNTKIEYLCRGYQLFVEEIKSLQVYLLSVFNYNNMTFPILLVPFSFGLNRLAYGHINFIEEFQEDKTIKVLLEKGKIEDNCIRSKIDFGIRTYTFYKKCVEKPYNLPDGWQISKNYTSKDSQLIQDKTAYIADCYSQYCYTGFTKKDIIYPSDMENTTHPTETRGNKLYDDLFLINYPFLLKSMELSQELDHEKELNYVSFEKHN